MGKYAKQKAAKRRKMKLKAMDIGVQYAAAGAPLSAGAGTAGRQGEANRMRRRGVSHGSSLGSGLGGTRIKGRSDRRKSKPTLLATAVPTDKQQVGSTGKSLGA